MRIYFERAGLGRRLAAFRRTLHITQPEMAAQCGISVYRLQKIESEQTAELDEALFLKICGVLAQHLEGCQEEA